MKPLNTILTAALGATLALTGCSSEGSSEDSECRGAKCDDLDKPDSEIEASPCDGIMVDKSGRGHQKVAGRLNDPVAAMAFRTGDDCPATFDAIMAKLNELDTEGCDAEDIGAGVATRLVSETAQATGTPTSYRAVTTRTCDGRAKHGIMFSLFGVRAGATSMPPNVEIMAFDEVEGVFNYYETDGRSINFFGNSRDMLKGKGAGDDRRCAQCHTGGGAIMKELDTPWLHWEGHMDIPGAADLVSANPVLGRKNSGSEFEGLVKAANRVWNEKRVAHVQENLDTRELLKPLFCTVEINLDNGADFESPVDGKKGTCSNDEKITCDDDTECGEGNSCSQQSIVTRIPADALLDPKLKGFGSINISHEDYQALLDANGSTVPGIPGAKDTVFDMAFAERAHADTDYLDKLKAAGVVDDELIKDVLMVDFTRPIFSDDRCDLLQFVPLLPSVDATAANIKAGLTANLGSPAPGSPAQELKNNLLNEAEDHQATVDAFVAACSALDQAEFLTNAYTIISGVRKEAQGHHVFEFPQTMATDNLSAAPGQRLDPTTCGIITNFVKVSIDAVDDGGGDDGGGMGGGDDGGGSATGAAACAPFNPLAAQPEGETPASSDICTCVTVTCDADDFCCNNTWDSICADAAKANTNDCAPAP